VNGENLSMAEAGKRLESQNSTVDEACCLISIDAYNLPWPGWLTGDAHAAKTSCRRPISGR